MNALPFGSPDPVLEQPLRFAENCSPAVQVRVSMVLSIRQTMYLLGYPG